MEVRLIVYDQRSRFDFEVAALLLKFNFFSLREIRRQLL